MIFVNTRNPKPLHEQIKDSILHQITSGILAPGEKLPSVREMSQSEGIAPNTIQRAYRELDALGVIVSYPGRGSFIAQANEQIRERRVGELFDKLAPLLAELRRLGVTKEELTGCLERGIGTDD